MDKFGNYKFGLSLVLAILISTDAGTRKNVFNVVDYGAVGDGHTNDTQAFERTWKYTCNMDNEISSTMIIPYGKTFLVYPLTLAGPCNLDIINIVILGKIVAPKDPKGWKGREVGSWIILRDVNGVSISGSTGLLDGNGLAWWDLSCKTNPQLQGCVTLAPTMLSLINCNEVYMGDLTFMNSPQTHILLLGCNNVNFKFLNIQSPGSTPNTDGIHIQDSNQVFIRSSNIATGDDCISVGDQTSNIYMSNVNCGPGHGISIGSLGKSGNEVQVENITVDGANFFNTTNGLRIKTWQSGRGKVRGVKYQNVQFANVENPIIIDQYYCDVRNGCGPTKTGVEVSDVRYNNALGTSVGEYAVNLNCSDMVPCTDILLDGIHLKSTKPGIQVSSSCNNAYGSATASVQPKPCLLNQLH